METKSVTFPADDPADPYRDFPFRVTWDGRVVGGVSKVAGLGPTRPAHRGDPAPPTQSGYAPVTLQGGVTHDADFVTWANFLWDPGDVAGGPSRLPDFLKEVVLELRNEAGAVVVVITIHNAWPSVFSSLPEPDASGNAVAFGMLELQHEGWEREDGVGKD